MIRNRGSPLAVLIIIIDEESCKYRANNKGLRRCNPLKPLSVNALPSGLEPETL